MPKYIVRWPWLLTCALLVLVTAGCYQQAGGDAPSTPIPQVLPTDTSPPSPTPEPSPLPTDTPLPTVQSPPTSVAQAEETEEAEEIPTEPPEVAQQPTEQIDPFAQTATAFIEQATLTIEAQLTGTAQGSGIGLTPTPTATSPGFMTPTPTTGTVPLGADCIHEVRPQDQNLFRISLRYGVTVHDIAAASGIANIDLITVGQRLTIPGCGTTGATPPPTSTPRATNTPVGQTQPGAPTTTAPQQPSGTVHVVEQGETLFEISLLYNVPVRDIASANGIADIDRIFIGQELVIPR